MKKLLILFCLILTFALFLPLRSFGIITEWQVDQITVDKLGTPATYTFDTASPTMQDYITPDYGNAWAQPGPGKSDLNLNGNGIFEMANSGQYSPDSPLLNEIYYQNNTSFSSGQDGFISIKVMTPKVNGTKTDPQGWDMVYMEVRNEHGDDVARLMWGGVAGYPAVIFGDEANQFPPISFSPLDVGSMGDYFGLTLAWSSNIVTAYYNTGLTPWVDFSQPTPDSSWSQNGTSIIFDQGDTLVKTYFGASFNTESSLTPEPSSILMLLGFGGMWLARRKKVLL